MRSPAFFAFFSLAPMSAGCGGDDPPAVASIAVQYEAGAPMGACNAVEQQFAIEGQAHVPDCSTVAYKTKPPSSGDHYGSWAAFKVYTNPIPQGYWVHALEHGAVVLTYNCPSPDSCAADVAAAEAMLSALPPEPLCLSAGTVPRRMIMTPDPDLDVRFAASAWGFTLRADCFDTEVFRSFVNRHYGAAPENTCAAGIDLSTGVPPGCGGR